MVRRIKSTERRIKHNCPTCQATYTLLETHLTKKDNHHCSVNCLKSWEAIIHKYCQEKVLGQELTNEQEEKDHGSN